MFCVKLIQLITLSILLGTACCYNPFGGTWDITSLSINFVTDNTSPDCSPCESSLFPAYGNLNNLPPYENATFYYTQYPNGNCYENVSFIWWPKSYDRIYFEYYSTRCVTNLYTYYFDVPTTLPYSFYVNHGLTFTLVEMNECPDDTFYCGEACCATGTVCTNPSTGQCCTAAIHTC